MSLKGDDSEAAEAAVATKKKEIDEHTLYLNDNIFFNILCID